MEGSHLSFRNLTYDIIKAIVCFLTVISLADCRQSQPSEGEGYVVVQDMLNRNVRIPDHVEKIVGIRAGSLRLLTYMAATDRIAGIEEAEIRGERPYTMAYPELLELPLIGPPMGGDAELIVKAGPDIIFMSYTTQGDADALQRKTGIPVIVIECPEFGTERDRFYASLQLIGKVLHKEDRADSLVTYIKNSIKELNDRTHSITNSERPSVYIGGVSYSGVYGINSTHPNYPPFMFINAGNVASAIDEKLVSHVRGTFIDIEQLLIWNPDYLFIDESGFNTVREDLTDNVKLFNTLNAVKNNRIFTLLPYNNYATNYEYIVINAWYAGKVMYPQAFSDIDIQKKANEIVSRFLGKKLDEDTNVLENHLRAIRKSEL